MTSENGRGTNALAKAPNHCKSVLRVNHFPRNFPTGNEAIGDAIVHRLRCRVGRVGIEIQECDAIKSANADFSDGEDVGGRPFLEAVFFNLTNHHRQFHFIASGSIDDRQQ